MALHHRRPHLPLRHPRHRPPLLLHRRAALLAHRRRHLLRARAARLPRHGDLRARHGAGRAAASTRTRSPSVWTVGCAVMSFVGAGFLGFAHTLPQVNLYTHGTLVTAMHGHLAFWGAYAMIVLAMIAYAMPQMTGRKLCDTPQRELRVLDLEHRHGRHDRSPSPSPASPRSTSSAAPAWTSSTCRRRSRCTSSAWSSPPRCSPLGILALHLQLHPLRAARR